MRARARSERTSGARGFTLVELLVASGLAALVMLALMRLIDASTELWTHAERRRGLVEQASVTGELVARDLRALHAGSSGDLVVDWFPHDLERDGRIERVWPRLRFVRAASATDLARIRERAIAEAARLARIEREEDAEGPLTVAEMVAASGVDPSADPGTLPPVDLTSVGLMEVAFAIVPAGTKGEARYEGLLVRAERLLEPGEPPVLLAADFFDRAGRPRPDLVEEITGGVLWLDVRLAKQTTVLDAALPDGGWRIDGTLTSAATSWDAWGLERPDPTLHVWNEPPVGMPEVAGAPRLPRRIRLEIEIERPIDRDRRTRVSSDATEQDARIAVDSGKQLDELVGRHVLVDGEWMRVKSVSGESFVAERGVRGTARRPITAGAMVHYGESLIVEIPIAAHRDDWTLGGPEGRR